VSANSEFFGQRGDQAVLKHGVLARYAHYFAGRAGAATNGQVAFIDGYAGEGRYEDGSPGSPLLLASQATRAELFGRHVKLALVEQDAGRRGRLQQSLSEAEVVPDQILGGSFEAEIHALLDRYAGHAVLLFVDPFGLGISRTTLQQILRRRSRAQPIDVLYHFSLSTVARMGRAAVMEGPLTERNAQLLDSALGFSDWRVDFEHAVAPAAPTEAALRVSRRFGEAVRAETRTGVTSIPVRQRPGHLPKYLLMLVSADRRAHWDFADQAAKAHIDWLYHCDRADYDANVRQRDESGVMELFPSPEPDAKEIEEQLKQDAERYLPDHISDLLRQRRELRPVDVVEEFYGEMLGRARATHVRAAIKMLHERGAVDDDAKGSYWDRPIRWTGS
jgi:three-Cys-motif partner protein